MNPESRKTIHASQEANTNQVQEQSANPENLRDLPNVKKCEQQLMELLQQRQSSSDFAEHAQRIIYEMLTRRNEFTKKVEQSGSNLVELMKNNKPQMDWYKKNRAAIEQAMDASEEFSWDSNPGWFGINTRPEAPKRKGINYKAYATVPVVEYSFIQHLPKLAQELRRLALETDDVIQAKVPETLTAFVSNNDSLVVHFKKKENVGKIMEVISDWMQSNDIHESPREMGRTKIAADFQDSSFSDLVSKNIATWLEQNAGQYDNALLAREAARYAIEQSQKSPIED